MKVTFFLMKNSLISFNHPHCHRLVIKSYPTLATPWTVVCRDPPPMGFSRQEYWRYLPFPSLRDLPEPGIEPRSPVLQAESFND